MAETYCGKTCAECTYREELSCPGCKQGPGRQFGGDCELARCCRSKGHEECATCGFGGNCRTLMGKQRIPEARQRQLMLQKAREAAMDKKAPILAKWLWLLFWLVVPSNIAAIMSIESLAEIAPGLYFTGKVISVLSSLAYGLILLKLTDAQEEYQKPGIYILISAAVSGAVVLVFGSTPPTWTLILTLPAAIASLAGLYKEIQAHSYALDGVDNDLSEKWTALWKWYVISYCGMIGGLLLVFLLPVLGLLAVLAGAICLIVVSILKLVRLYNTAQVFRARAGS